MRPSLVQTCIQRFSWHLSWACVCREQMLTRSSDYSTSPPAISCNLAELWQHHLTTLEILFLRLSPITVWYLTTLEILFLTGLSPIMVTPSHNAWNLIPQTQPNLVTPSHNAWNLIPRVKSWAFNFKLMSSRAHSTHGARRGYLVRDGFLLSLYDSFGLNCPADDCLFFYSY